MAALPRLRFQLLSDDPHGIYKSFPKVSGHTLVGRLVNDWETIPDGATLIIETLDGDLLEGKHTQLDYATWKEFSLKQPGNQADQCVYAELVAAVYEPVAYVSGEAFVVQPVTA